MIDSHCHLDDKAFNADLDEVVKRSSFLKAIITASSSFHSNQKNKEISEKYKNVYPCFGLYPGNAIKEKKTEDTIEFIKKNKCVAIGEVGIDYYWFKTREEKGIQTEAFEKFIDLANETKLPLIVHSRNAEDDAVNILEKKAENDVVFHCFCGSEKQAKRIVDAGFFVSFSTRHCWLKDSQSLINAVSLENILAETDSPYNHPKRTARNEPANVKSAYSFIASAKEEIEKNVEKTIDKNAGKIFRIKL